MTTHSDVDVAVVFPAGLSKDEAFWRRVRLQSALEDLLRPLAVDVAAYLGDLLAKPIRQDRSFL